MHFRTKLFNSGLMAISLLVAIPAAKGQVQFSGPTYYPVGTAPPAIAIGDFNGDGIPDLVVANAGNVFMGDDGNVGILLGNGDGTFRATRSFDAGKNPWSIAEGDFNHDGNQDLAVRDGGETSVSILLGNGDGSFQAPVKFTVGPGGDSETITAADFDGDGNLDLAVANSDGTISVLLGNGDGAFRPAVSYDVWGSPIALIADDFNHDQKLDIAVSSEEYHSENYQGKIIVLLGKGDGSFQPPLETIIPGRSFWIAPGDLNGDGQLDILVTASNFVRTTVLALLLGEGDGTFQPPVDIDPTKTPGTIFAGKVSPVVADFNNDLKLDVAVDVNYLVTSDSPDVPPVLRVLLGNGDGSFQAREDIALPFTLTTLYAGDFNRDKFPDVVIANQDGISILLNNSMAPTDFPLVVTPAGSGTGSVTSSPAGIDCGGSCTANFPAGTNVILTASPGSASTFSGWGELCSGAGTCIITMDTSASVTATFTSTSSIGDFSVTPATSSLSLKRGGQTVDTLTFAAQGGFTGTISLACLVSGPSPTPTCSISPGLVTPGTKATLAVNATALTAAVRLRPFERAGTLFATALPLGLMSLVVTMCFDKKRRRFWALSLLILLATILPAACGGRVTPRRLRRTTRLPSLLSRGRSSTRQQYR
jgi:hypothetical protein